MKNNSLETQKESGIFQTPPEKLWIPSGIIHMIPVNYQSGTFHLLCKKLMGDEGVSQKLMFVD